MPAKKSDSKSTAPASPKSSTSKKSKPADASQNPKKSSPAKATKAPAKEPKKTPATKTKGATPAKTPAKPNPPVTPPPPPTPSKPTAVAPAPQTNADAQVWRVRIACVAGPYWDADGTDVCMRAIDILDTSSLYDLHTAILESIHFEEHDESVFSFFTAMDFRGRRTYLGDGNPLNSETDISRFEELVLARSIPTSRSSQFLYYVFDADDPWVFRVTRDPTTRPPSPHEFYPLVRDELNRGPDPIQFGDGLDDFADIDDGEEFNELRGEFRKRRRAQEESGLDDDDFDDLTDNVNDMFSRDDDSSGFFGNDDEENFDPYSGFGNDDW